MDYIGYANEAAHTMIAELMMHPVVLNTEKREIFAFFMAPWSDSPNMTLKEYGRKLYKRQRAAKKQGVKISYKGKTTHSVGCAKDSGLFKEKWVTEWEATPDRTWNAVRNVWVVKWLEVTSTAIMAAKRGGYKSVAALRGTRETPSRYLAPITVTRAEYDALSRYACAQKGRESGTKIRWRR